MFKRASLCMALAILALCSFSQTGYAQNLQFFPPDNVAACNSTTSGSILVIKNGVSHCVSIPDSCPNGQIPAFINGVLSCQPANVTGNGICRPGKVAFAITGLSNLGSDRGQYQCCDPSGSACETDTVPLASCIPSGFPNGQPNLYNTSSLAPQTIAAGVSTSCGQASGYALNCCSKQAQWTQIVRDNYGILPLSRDQFGMPMTAGSNTYACLCR